MESVDAVAARYGTRPSVLLGVVDPVRAFLVDVTAARWGIARDNNPHVNVPRAGGRRRG